jgi:hypothetical protein
MLYEKEAHFSSYSIDLLQDGRRRAAAEAASRRVQQTERRGVDEEGYRRLKEKQDQLELQQAKLAHSYGNSNDDGLRVSDSLNC